MLKKIIESITLKQLLWIGFGAMIFSFGIYNIHQRTSITEGGVIGLTLFFEHYLNVSLAYITPLLDGICYFLAYKALGFTFIKLSAVSTVFISLFYKLWEQFPYVLPDLSQHPLLSAILGGFFVGVGAGLVIKQGGSLGGDDALALTIHRYTNLSLAHSYLFTDISVLLLSLTYIPLQQIIFSLITVTLSSHLIDWVKNYQVEKKPIN